MGNFKDKFKWILRLLSESKTLRYIQVIMNVMVFLCLFVSGIIIINIDKMLGTIILLVMAMFLVLNKTGRR